MNRIPSDFIFTHGDSIHTSAGDRRPHLTGTLCDQTTHLPYSGQTTLGMFDRRVGAHRIDEVQSLMDQFPGTFRGSGF